MAYMPHYGDSNMAKIKTTPIHVLKFFWPSIWINQPAILKIKIILFIFATILTTVILVSVPIALKYAVAALETHEGKFGLSAINLVVLYGVMWMMTKIIARLRQQAAYQMMADIISKVCTDVFAHLQRLSMRFHYQRKSGKILNTISRTRFAVDTFADSLFQEIIPITLQVILASIILATLVGIKYGLVLIGMLLLYFMATRYTVQSIVICRQAQNEADGAANAYIVDSLLNAETVKYFDMAEYEYFQTEQLLREKEVADEASLMADAKIDLIQNAIIGIAMILLTLMSGLEVMHHTMKVSAFVMINGYVLMFIMPLSLLGYFYRQCKLSLTHLESAIELLQEPIDMQDSPQAQPLNFHHGEIVFDHVSFGFNSKRIILKDVTFNVPAGSTAAIVGESGSGKSTISKLLYRLFDVDSGAISIDGQNLKDVTHDSFCHILGIVPQDTVMFNDTLYNNICYANAKISDETLHQILSLAQLTTFIENLPDKLNTVVGERGLKLSGGERQRVAIARMLVRRPKIMILDEATSALDLKTEKEIQDCLIQISQKVTTIIIAHRLSTIQHADNIIVLDDGIIAEQGTHDDLIARQGIYYKLHTKQQHKL